MWILPVTPLKQFPQQLKKEGVYVGYLLRNQQQYSFFEFADSEIEHNLNKIWSICPIPPNMHYPRELQNVLKRWLHFHSEIAGPLNQLQQNEKVQLEGLIKDLIQCTNQNECKNLSINAKRSELNSWLTHYPLYCTLLFIESMSIENDKLWWTCLLARIQRCIGVMSYDLCLSFDRARRDFKQVTSLEVNALVQMSNLQLAMFCKEISELGQFANIFTQRQNQSKESRPLIYKSDNEYQQSLMLSDDVCVDLYYPVDLEGNELASYMHFSTPIESLERPELTYHQQQQKFSLRRSSIESAISRENKMHVMTNSSLTPFELSAWLRLICEELFDNQLDRIEVNDRAHWFLFFLRLFLGKISNQLMLFNDANKTDSKPVDQCLIYSLADNKGACIIYIRLSTKLFQGKNPPAGSKQYFSAQKYFDVMLPWPLASLSNLVLRNIPLKRRHNISIYSSLKTSEVEHRKWLRHKINQVKSEIPFNVSYSAILNSFQCFTSQSMPSVYRDYLKQQGSVLMHYVNDEQQQISEQVRREWFRFLKVIGLNQSQDWSNQTSLGLIGQTTYHSQVGSAITLRDSMLVEIIDALVSPLFELKMSEDKIEITQRIALYLHIRSAIELALRPVKQPYPQQYHIAWEDRVMSVSDKRVHHQQERRLIVLSENLVKVLKQYQLFCRKVDGSFNSMSLACLTYFDGEAWQIFNQANVIKLCKQYLDDIDPGCFRHICASQFTQLSLAHQNLYQQQALNQKMNHYLRGQNPLGEFALLSISKAVDYQRDMTKTCLLAEQNDAFRQKIESADKLIIDLMKK
ncbi:hypothetical protein [Shewanella gaetbuli]